MAARCNYHTIDYMFDGSPNYLFVKELCPPLPLTSPTNPPAPLEGSVNGYVGGGISGNGGGAIDVTIDGSLSGGEGHGVNVGLTIHVCVCMDEGTIGVDKVRGLCSNEDRED